MFYDSSVFKRNEYFYIKDNTGKLSCRIIAKAPNKLRGTKFVKATDGKNYYIHNVFIQKTPPPKEPTPPLTPSPPIKPAANIPVGYELADASDLSTKDYYFFFDEDGALARGIYTGEHDNNDLIIQSGSSRYRISTKQLFSKSEAEEKQAELPIASVTKAKSDTPVSDIVDALMNDAAVPLGGLDLLREVDPRLVE